jgi:hypothetical protein
LTGVDWVGWLSSAVLLMTLGQQVRSQWMSGESRGVSRWLFAGQLLASLGFALYSYLLSNWVFLVTNLLLVINALLGEWVTVRNSRRKSAR